MVDAGGCSLAKKVRHIENAGGAMALISDAYFDSIYEVYMEDLDGSGYSLTIPGVLISKEDGDAIKAEYLKDPSINM